MYSEEWITKYNIILKLKQQIIIRKRYKTTYKAYRNAYKQTDKPDILVEQIITDYGNII